MQVQAYVRVFCDEPKSAEERKDLIRDRPREKLTAVQLLTAGVPPQRVPQLEYWALHQAAMTSTVRSVPWVLQDVAHGERIRDAQDEADEGMPNLPLVAGSTLLTSMGKSLS